MNFKNKILINTSIALILMGSCNSLPYSEEEIIDKSSDQLRYLIGLVDEIGSDSMIFPRTEIDGSLSLVSSADWTSGFFPGSLWLMFDLTNNDYWKKKADFYTNLLEKEQYNTGTHDLGFMMYCSYGQAYRLTGSEKYKDVLINAAQSLASRYNPVVGCIRSWDFNQEVWDFPVIIDNMLNLELLYWASKETGDSIYREIATEHAINTMKNHFRKDFSTYHVIDYNPHTGEVRKKNTYQGYKDNSTWSRGQAWALYGFTMCYRETGLKEFLELAQNIAKFIFSHNSLPDDLIPYWDFDAPDIPDAPRDASAASVIASALYELSCYSENSQYYKQKADKIIQSLSSNKYFAKQGTNNGFLLKHSTGFFSQGHEIDMPLSYADYYFLEAIVRNRKYN